MLMDRLHANAPSAFGISLILLQKWFQTATLCTTPHWMIQAAGLLMRTWASYIQSQKMSAFGMSYTEGRMKR
jgi:hypothetical protein